VAKRRSIDAPAVPVSRYDLLCFSHLRWDFVFQRPQHLLTRCARERRVFFFEEPIVEDGPPRLELRRTDGGIRVAVPRLPAELLASPDPHPAEQVQRALVDELLRRRSIHSYVLWYASPMAPEFSRHLDPAAVVYDCMDELSAFLGAPPALCARERELFERADLVFTGGQSLYEAKRGRHRSVHCFPSSIEAAHFGQARAEQLDPADQAGLARP